MVNNTLKILNGKDGPLHFPNLSNLFTNRYSRVVYSFRGFNSINSTFPSYLVEILDKRFLLIVLYPINIDNCVEYEMCLFCGSIKVITPVKISRLLPSLSCSIVHFRGKKIMDEPQFQQKKKSRQILLVSNVIFFLCNVVLFVSTI